MSDQWRTLRIKVRKQYFPFYKALLKKRLFHQHSEFFTLCCSVGSYCALAEKDEQSIPFVELCQANTLTHYQETVIKSAVFKQMGVLEDGKAILSHAEKIADAGFEYIKNNLPKDVISVNDHGDVMLMPGKEVDFQLALSKLVYHQAIAVPF